MIDLATTVRKSRVYNPLNSHKSKKVESIFSNNKGIANSDLPDMARRIVSSSPEACIAMAFAVGGIFGWLTSRR